MNLTTKVELMNAIDALIIGNISIPLNQLPELMKKYHLIPQLVREMIIDRAIINYQVSAEEEMKGIEDFCFQNRINNDQELDFFLRQQQLDKNIWLSLIERKLRLQKFKDAEWGNQVESYFSQQKNKIDRVIYSMIQVKDIDIAEELYFRILSQEATFSELAPLYSSGIEAKTRGISEAVEIGELDTTFAVALLSAEATEVLPPMNLNGWWIIAKLEAFIPAELDKPTQHRLKDELFDSWIIKQTQEVISSKIDSTESLFDMSLEKLALIAQDATIDSVQNLHEKNISTYGIKDGILHETKPSGEVIVTTNRVRVG